MNLPAAVAAGKAVPLLTTASPLRRFQYEALRAYFVEQLPSQEVARRFGYSPGSFRILTCDFRQNPDRPLFLPPAKGMKRVK